MDRKLIISTVALLVLVAFYFFDSSKQSSLQNNYTKIFDFNHDSIEKVIIMNQSSAIELVRSDSLWSISGNDTLAIKQSSIDNLFNKALEVKVNTIEVSKYAKDLSIYSLDSLNGVNLILMDKSGSALSNIVLGLSAENYFSNYYREYDSNIVYRTNINVLNFLPTSPLYWGETPKIEAPEDTTSVTPSEL